MATEFLYFDLGKVLVDFDYQQMLRQVAAAAGVDEATVRRVLFDDGLQAGYECGTLDRGAFHKAFSRATGTAPDPVAFHTACSDFFELKSEMVPLVVWLQQAGYPMGVLSNTCPGHWEHCVDKFRVIRDAFPVQALSYRLGVAKPQAAMFAAAAQLAGAAAETIFFTDDAPANVAGARAAGWDAVLFTSAHQLAGELRRRGIDFNY